MEKYQHLQMIQAAISGNEKFCLLMRGAALAVTAGLFGAQFLYSLAASVWHLHSNVPQLMLPVGIGVLGILWAMDAHYKARELAFVRLYEEVREKDGAVGWEMNPHRLNTHALWVRALWARPGVLLHIGLITAVALLVLV